jgi:two-component system, cell cycle sensor histidine kinase and response regulator CckA
MPDSRGGPSGSRREPAARRAEVMSDTGGGFQALFEVSPLPLMLTDAASGEILATNRLGERLSGLTGEQLRGRSVFDFGHYRDEADRTAQIAALGRNPGDGREMRLTTPQGVSLRLLAHTSPVTIDGRKCLLTALTNVSSLGRLDEGLLAAQRMDVVGKLAGGVAHEFNNLLTVMQGHLEALALESDSHAGIAARVAALGRAVDQATRITQGLLTFSGRSPVNAVAVDLNVALDGLRSLIAGTVGETIGIDWALDATPATVTIGEAQLAQVVLNLALNAREAMPEGGRLTIGTTWLAEAPTPIGRGAPGPWVRLQVEDTGHGMSDDVRRQAFEPFFTTKGPGQGMGLGLSICQGIAEQIGGGIAVRSTVGEGTSVHVYLPFAAVAPTTVARRPATSARTGRVVLLVEDEADVRNIVAEILRRAGHVVHAVDGMAAAEAALDALTTPLDLLLSDLVLPGVNGLEVARRVRLRHPDLPVLFMSGYSENVFAGGQTVDHLLQKPFSARRLLDTIADLLPE